jgi:hypothetical protein
VDDPAHWRDRAEEARSHAEQMGDETSRQTMLQIADDYERLAKHAERRATHSSKVERDTPADPHGMALCHSDWSF